MWKNHEKRREVHSHEGPKKWIRNIPASQGPTNHEIVGNADPPMALRGVSRYCFKQPLPEAKFRDIKIQVLPDPLPSLSDPPICVQDMLRYAITAGLQGVLKFHLQKLSVNQRGIWLIL